MRGLWAIVGFQHSDVGASLTPYEIARVVGNSSGAAAKALDRLVDLGHA